MTNVNKDVNNKCIVLSIWGGVIYSTKVNLSNNYNNKKQYTSKVISIIIKNYINLFKSYIFLLEKRLILLE